MADVITLQSASSALWFLPFAAPICIWAAMNDLKHMKIPNKSVMALFIVYAVIGLIALPFEDYAWRYLHLVVVLVIGFGLNMAGALGAGDAKFAAAMAPFVVVADTLSFMILFLVTVLVQVPLHRLARATPAIRRLSPTWVSWQRKKFPMGLCLGSSLILYLGIGALYGI